MGAARQARVVFVSYAHEDTDLLDRLLVVLKPLVREGHVELWADQWIEVARRWSDQIESNLLRAEVAVLLVSADFLASDYIMEVELPRLVERDVPLVCVPVGPCAWKRVDAIASVQWPLPPERPLRAMRRDRRDGALVAVFEAVETLATSLGPGDPDRAGPTSGPRPAAELSAATPGPLLGVPTLPAGYQPRSAASTRSRKGAGERRRRPRRAAGYQRSARSWGSGQVGAGRRPRP